MSQIRRFLTIFCLLQVERHQKESHIGCQANKNTALLIPVIVSSVTDGQVGEGLVSHILLLVVSIISGNDLKVAANLTAVQNYKLEDYKITLAGHDS